MRSAAVWLACWMVLFGVAGIAWASEKPVVVKDRPRVFFRAKAWDGGLSVEKVKGWMSRPEYKAYARDLKGLTGDALRYLLLDDQDAGKRAVAALKALKIPDKVSESPSYTGIELAAEAAAYDWLHDHPDLANDRKGVIAYLEWWGGHFMKHNSPGVVPFYSRNSGALEGQTAIGLALYGDSPKAEGFLDHACKYLRENMGTIRQVEDGATGGGSYGMIHEFKDLAQAVELWRTGTNWDAAKWIKENQGDWLERQMLYQIWATDPNGWLWKEGDVWSGGGHSDKNEHRMSIDAITTMYKNGYGRTWADQMAKRHGKVVYYPTESWMFFLDNDPEVTPKPLEELGRTAVFSPKLHAFVCWRDSWNPDATVVRFKAGENTDHHGTWDTGKFTIFKYAPLAIKNGAYLGGYKGGKHLYYKSPWSANVVIFDGPKNRGWQPSMPDLDGYTSWTAWKARRDAVVKHPVTGVLVSHEEKDEYASALADLSGSTYPSGSTWIRELVFLGYKYLIVLDRVKPGPEVKTRWLLQSINEPTIDAAARVATIDNGKGRLFCKTLLPDGAKMEKVGGGGKAFVHKNQKGDDVIWAYDKGKKVEQQLGAGRLDVVPADEGAECVYLHVLYPTDTGVDKMPDCSVTKQGENLVVKIADLSHTFVPPKKAGN